MSRLTVDQIIDFKVYITTCYHESEYTPELIECLSPFLIKEEKLGSYFFLTYQIDDYVTDFTISRNVTGNPARLSISIFPESINSKITFRYNLNGIELPVFRRMDFIEIKVASSFVNPNKIETQYDKDLKYVLSNSNAKNNSKYDYLYKTRFRGFITTINESDSADDGIKYNLDGFSILYYLSMTPFIQNLALFTDTFLETQRMHLLANQYIVLYGDLLQNLQDTISRVKLMMEEIFMCSSTIYKQLNYYKSEGFVTDEYYVANVGFIDVQKKKLSEYLTDSKKIKGTQALLIPLAELYCNIKSDDLLYKIYKSYVFDVEIQFSGSNKDFISNYLYLLQVLNNFKENIQYVLFEKGDGTIVYDRIRIEQPPLDTLHEDLFLRYSYRETADNYYTEVLSTPGTALKLFDDSIREALFKSSGYAIDELRRFGYRRPEVQTNPNVSDPIALQYYSTVYKIQNNSQLLTLDIQYPYLANINIGDMIWFKGKNLTGFVTEITESINFGGRSESRISMSFLRKTKVIDPKKDKGEISGFTKFDKLNIEDSYGIKYNLYIEDIPEYQFISDFYKGKIKIFSFPEYRYERQQIIKS